MFSTKRKYDVNPVDQPKNDYNPKTFLIPLRSNMDRKIIQERFENIIKAIEAERKHDELFFKNLHESKSLQEKVDSGFVWYPIEIVRVSYTIGDYVEVEVKNTKPQKKDHRFYAGVAVGIFNSLDEDIFIRGIVNSMRRDTMKLLIPSDFIDQIPEKGLTGIEMIYDDRPYKVMLTAIQDVIKSDLPHIRTLANALASGEIEQRLNILNENSSVPSYLNGLNPSQRAAVGCAALVPVISIIHGPPGTGKTTTMIGLCQVLLHTEKRILVCAPSNNAVDLLAERLSEKGVSVLRVGNISRIADDLTHLTIEEKVKNHPEWNHIKKVKIQARETEKKAFQYKRQFGHEERELRKELKKEARDLHIWASEIEDRLTDSIVKSSHVIASTLIGVSNRILKDIRFDTVIIDEASQALEPECWNAILKAKRVILAGDHLQLPPTVKSPEALKAGMAITMLDILAPRLKECYLLDTQYRMHQRILSFSNARFYEGKLLSDPKAGAHLLRNDTEPLIFIDTAGCGFDEEHDEETKSYQNDGEFQIIKEHLLKQSEKYLGSSIGIISPYKDQVKYIREQLSDDSSLHSLDIEVNSIDGYQGQEKDIIYISLVRSNDKGEIGFLKDERRLNVAMTRAKKKLVMVGDSACIGQYELFASMIAHIEETGTYESAWNYMGY